MDEEGIILENDLTVFSHNLIWILEFHPPRSCIKWLKGLPSEHTLSKKILHYLLAEDYPNCIRVVIEALNARGTALHDVAYVGANHLAQVSVYSGLDPNVRLDFHADGTVFKQILPLDAVLENIRGGFHFNWGGSIFKLICKLCAIDQRHILETTRVLALHTKELDQEIIKYTKEGEVERLCALMLVGYYSQIPSVECFEGDRTTKEQMLELVEIFQRIGDKLQVYITLPRSSSTRPGRVVMDISSLFKDAGLTVKSIDTIMYRGRDKFVKQDNASVGKDNRSLKVDYRSPFSILDETHLGSRSLHTISMTKVRKDVAPIFPGNGYAVPKSSFWKNSSFWMVALRRAVRAI